jgi:hypothetical protein
VSEFEDKVDTEGLTPDEEARLRRVHDLLVSAGPPPELPATLRTQQPRPATVVPFPRRRAATRALAAVAAAAAVFAVGYVLGHSRDESGLHAEHVVAMHGPGGARATLRIARADAVGNWPMEVEVRGLPQQRARFASYELWLTRNHRPAEPCGSFRVHGSRTTVRFSVPYDFRGADGWVVTAQPHGTTRPGSVVLST